MIIDNNEIKSPCINICRLTSTQVCEGCGRHIDEIVAWRELNRERRLAVIAMAQKRLREMVGERQEGFRD